MADPVVIFEELEASGGKKIAKAELNVPKTLNSLTLEMVELILEKLAQWQADDSVACILFTGSGEKAFCAGGDVQALHASAIKTPGGPCVEAETFFAREYRMNYAIHTCAKPVLVWGSGIVMGGGLGIFAGGSHRVVTESSRFAMPEVTIALFPDVGGSYFLNRAPGASGRFLALTGASFNAADAVYLGVASHFVQDSLLDQVVDALCSSAPCDHAELDTVLASFVESSIDARPASNVENHQAEIDKLCSASGVEDVVAAFAALETDDKWLSKAKQGLQHGSALAVTWIDHQLKQAAGLALSDVFRSELVLATNIVRHPEFAEGVRALLIDKDRKPQWQFADVADIPSALLESFFVAPWPENPLADL